MAIGKPLRKDFYSNGETGGIEMPPLNEQPPISAAAPDPWSSQPLQEQSAAAPVPDYIPQESLEEMNRAQNVGSSNVDNLSSVEDDLETAEDEDEIEEVTPQPRRAQDNPANRRIRELKEAQKKAERERDELLRMMQMQQMQQQSPKQQQPEPEEEEFHIEDDALVEGKTIRQMNAKMKAMQDQLRNYQAQSAESITEAKIKAAYPDFDRVVSQENIAQLREDYPELANTLHSTTDLYSKAVSAYTLIKQFGIAKDPRIENDRARVIKNVAKPRPLASVSPQQGDSPLSKANAFANGDFTKEMQEAARKEMFAAMKNH